MSVDFNIGGSLHQEKDAPMYFTIFSFKSKYYLESCTDIIAN